jgi:hypothetical protein
MPVSMPVTAFDQKFANLRANPYVVLTTGCNQWDLVRDEDVNRRVGRPCEGADEP